MAVKKQTDFGKIQITDKAIASIVCQAAMECYGVVGICNRKASIRDIVYEILKASHYAEGIAVKNNKTNVDISLYIAVAFGVKVTEVLRSVQKKVKYVVEQSLDTKVGKVNVYVQHLSKVD